MSYEASEDSTDASAFHSLRLADLSKHLPQELLAVSTLRTLAPPGRCRLTLVPASLVPMSPSFDSSKSCDANTLSCPSPAGCSSHKTQSSPAALSFSRGVQGLSALSQAHEWAPPVNAPKLPHLYEETEAREGKGPAPGSPAMIQGSPEASDRALPMMEKGWCGIAHGSEPGHRLSRPLQLATASPRSPLHALTLVNRRLREQGQGQPRRSRRPRW